MPEQISPILEPRGRTNLSLEEIHSRVQTLKKEFQFSDARSLLIQAIEEYPDDSWLSQQLALCTYKDKNLNPASARDHALAILEKLDLRHDTTIESEILALAGVIYKEKWEQQGQEKFLYEALAFYRAAYERDPGTDKGHGGVQAAYILDILASRSRMAAARTHTPPKEADELTREATLLRDNLVRNVPKLWRATVDSETLLNQNDAYLMTMAEIHFGLEQWGHAQDYLQRLLHVWATHTETRKDATKTWNKETLLRQLAHLATLRQYPLPQAHMETSTWHEAWQTLATLTGRENVHALSRNRGKVGLALSGGGFRAALFHLGVMARLAEADVLRHVEVLSTVSGGSIVGAQYYLELKRRLEEHTTHDLNELTPQDYGDIVAEVINTFVTGVQENIRTRAFADFTKNLRMIFSPEYGRSHRLGELYEERLYGRIKDTHPKDQPRTLQSLLINPQHAKFSPKFQNGERHAKVPILLLNTTSLNSGHNWHFTASWMGEPPGLLGGKVDKNERYRRLYYGEAPTEELQRYRLGYAVAASACVPGLFDPLSIDGLYQDRTVRLVDGGVHDNQGVAGLLNEGCTVIFCSDASGQLEDAHHPPENALGVLLRATSIQGDRIREAEYQTLKERVDTEALQGLFFVHLKKDLPLSVVNWISCKAPSRSVEKTTTPYGIDIDLQKQLAAIRTDLDSFTEVESYALMLSGYQMTDYELRSLQERHQHQGEPGQWGGFEINAPMQKDWPFLPLKEIMKLDRRSKDPRRQDLGQQLEVASQLAFKIWRLSPGLRAASWGIGISASLMILAAIYLHRSDVLQWEISIGQLSLLVIVTLGIMTFPLLKWLNPQKAAREYVSKTVIAFLGYLAARAHLHIFDPWFLKRGKLSRLMNLHSKDTTSP